MNSKYLYLTLDLLSVSIPLIASFYRKAPFFRTWRSLWVAILIPAVFFLIWDEFFTRAGIWGFNPQYLTGIYIGSLPLEEVLFFICIPYACVFTYYAMNYLIAKDLLWASHEIITSVLIIFLLIAALYNIEKAYTASTFMLLAIFLAYELLKRRVRYTGRFYVAFAVILIPFFFVNGILTGSFIPGEVVWYDNTHNLGIRLGTIPVEDVFYGMLLLILNVSIYERLESRQNGKRKR